MTLSSAISSKINAFTRRADDNNKWSLGKRDRRISIDLQMWSLALWKLPELYSKTYKAYDKSSSAVATAKFLLPWIERLMSNARCNQAQLSYNNDNNNNNSQQRHKIIEWNYRVGVHTSNDVIDVQQEEAII